MCGFYLLLSIHVYFFWGGGGGGDGGGGGRGGGDAGELDSKTFPNPRELEHLDTGGGKLDTFSGSS